MERGVTVAETRGARCCPRGRTLLRHKTKHGRNRRERVHSRLVARGHLVDAWRRQSQVVPIPGPRPHSYVRARDVGRIAFARESPLRQEPLPRWPNVVLHRGRVRASRIASISSGPTRTTLPSDGRRAPNCNETKASTHPWMTAPSEST